MQQNTTDGALRLLDDRQRISHAIPYGVSDKTIEKWSREIIMGYQLIREGDVNKIRLRRIHAGLWTVFVYHKAYGAMLIHFECWQNAIKFATAKEAKIKIVKWRGNG